MNRFHVTFDIVTPESAECGDIDDSGFVDSYGFQYSTHAKPTPFVIETGAACGMRLSEALNLISVCESSDGFAYYESDGRQNYETGAETRRAFHLPRNATGASVARVRRLMQSRGLLL